MGDRELWWSQGAYESNWEASKPKAEVDQREKEAPHLQNISASVMAATGKAAFTVAGVLPPSSFPKGIALTFPHKTGNEVTLNLPCEPTEPEFKNLLEACEAAKFGRGTQLVFDEKVRKALAMPADKLSSCTFQISDHPEILDTIKNIMMPGSASVTAKLDKLNIYRPGDFFKAHQDTPRGGETFFGSLVVCLPVGEHSGGGLVVNGRDCNNQIINHFFGRDAARGAVAWAAHYSEIDHEVEKVESGYRLTLTYQLIADEAEKGADSKSKGKNYNQALAAALENAFRDPSFMPTGGKLGFPCSHRYAHEKGVDARKNLKSLLKGSDNILVSTVSDLPGLNTAIVRVYKMPNEDGVEQIGCDGSSVLGYSTGFGGRICINWVPLWISDTVTPQFELPMEDYYLETEEEMIRMGDPNAKASPEIRWIGGSPLTKESFQYWKKAGKGYIFGNEDAYATFAYATLAVVVEVPPYEDRQQQYGGGGNSGEAGPSLR